jgi:hypothetical protein
LYIGLPEIFGLIVICTYLHPLLGADETPSQGFAVVEVNVVM